MPLEDSPANLVRAEPDGEAAPDVPNPDYINSYASSDIVLGSRRLQMQHILGPAILGTNISRQTEQQNSQLLKIDLDKKRCKKLPERKQKEIQRFITPLKLM